MRNYLDLTHVSLRICAVALLACAAEGDAHGRPAQASGLTSCEPLAAQAQAITLGGVIAAGRAADGTLYVADELGTADPRVFVERDGVLVRRRVLGSGTISEAQRALAGWSFDDARGARQLMVHTRDGKVEGMALADGNEKPSFALFEHAEKLTVVDADAARALPLRDLSGEVVVEYFADVEDGTQLLVIRPRDDSHYEDFRLFWGRDGEFVEREVERTVRYKDGGTTKMSFRVEGDTYEAYFPSTLSRRAPPTLTHGADVLAMELSEPSADQVAAASFECLPR